MIKLEDKVYYVRVSTQKDEQDGSYENQIEYFNSIGITKGYADKGSGTSINRPNFQRMLKDAGLNITQVPSGGKYKYIIRQSNREPLFHHIYVKSISRFSRNNAEQQDIIRELKDKGVYIHFVDTNLSTEGYGGELLLALTGALAEDESKQLSTRIQFGNNITAQKGITRSIGLYGYQYIKEDKSLQIIPNEAEVIKLIFNLREQGLGSRRIANYLNNNRYTTRSGSKWLGNVIGRLLRNKTYCGYSVRNRYKCNSMYNNHSHKIKPQEEWIEIKSDKIQPIISEEQFSKVQQLIDGSRIEGKGKYNGVSTLAGKIICDKCNSSYWRNSRKNKNGEYYFYNCSTRRKDSKLCNNRNISEEYMLKKLHYIYENYTNIYSNFGRAIDRAIDNKLNILHQSLKNENSDHIRACKEELDALKIKEDKILDLYLEGVISKDKYKERIDNLANIRNTVEAKLKILTMGEQQFNELKNETAKIRRVYKSIGDILNVNKSNSFNEFIEQHLDKIIIADTREKIILDVHIIWLSLMKLLDRF